MADKMEEEKDKLDGLETYLTPKDIQKHLGICRTKTYELIGSNNFSKVMMLKSIRILKKDYIKWLEAQRRRGVFI